jgi:hypothetical protein
MGRSRGARGSATARSCSGSSEVTLHDPDPPPLTFQTLRVQQQSKLQRGRLAAYWWRRHKPVAVVSKGGDGSVYDVE